MLKFLVLCALAATVYADCGVQVIAPSLNKIVGGDEATPGSWPWQVMLRKKYLGGDYQFCGGTLINDQWVVTAAHCFYRYGSVNLYSAVVGAHDRDAMDATQSSYGISQVFLHEDYNTATLDNDITLLKLASPVTLSDYVNYACLPSGTVPSEGTECVVTGWGNQETVVDDSTLQQVVVPVISTAQCNRAAWYGGDITDNMICAGFKDGGKDSCQGDSGGPMVCQTGGAYELTGVVSWGYGCADARKPGVYAKVNNYVSWINNIVANN